MASPPSPALWGSPHRPPAPSAYLQSWLARGGGDKSGGDKQSQAAGSSVENVERDLFELTSDNAPKTASKELLGRTLPRLAAYGAPGPGALAPFVGMLADGAVSERYAIRYGYYFIQRILEHYGGMLAVGNAEGVNAAVATLASEARERTGARQILATRALTAAARMGVTAAAAALDAGTSSAMQQLAMGKVPNGGGKKKSSMTSIFSSSDGGGAAGGTDSATRAAMGARRRMMTSGAWRHNQQSSGRGEDRSNNNNDDDASNNDGGSASTATAAASSEVVPPATALATAVASSDAIAARHALSLALVAAKGAEFEALARALEPGLAAAARDLEARNAAAAAAASADHAARAAQAVAWWGAVNNPNPVDP
jgi:hypothetical protein